MDNRPPTVDPKELVPFGIGLLLGVGIMAFFVVLGLMIGLTPSITFGCPHQ